MGNGIFFAGNGVPLGAAADIVPFLGSPTHWREGRSAYEAACAWFDAEGIPPALLSLIEGDPFFVDAILEAATFEKQTALDGFGRASQTDVLAVLKTGAGRAVLAVEAKVDESFGPTVAEWRVNGSRGKQQRLAGLVERLNLDPLAIDTLRYQLLHRAAAALIEAATVGADRAGLMVQSFSPEAVRAGFADFCRFAEALGTPVERPGQLSPLRKFGGIGLQLGWAICPIRSVRLPP